MTTTLLQLRDRAKQESDNVGSSFISDAEWNTYIQSSYSELYGLLVQAYGTNYAIQTPTAGYTFTTTGATQFYALPSGFFKLLAVDLQLTTDVWVPLRPFPMAERNQGGIGNTQTPMAGQTIRLLYVPLPTLPTVDASTIEGVNGWEEYIVIDAAMKALAKEESDVSVLAMRKQAFITRLESEIDNRDAGSPVVIADVWGRQARAMRYRVHGDQLWRIGNGMPGYGPWGDWDYSSYGGGW